VNSMHLTRGRVDASPEHLRPCINGGTGVRTVRAASSDVGRLYPHFWEEQLDAVWSGIQSENLRYNRWTG